MYLVCLKLLIIITAIITGVSLAGSVNTSLDVVAGRQSVQNGRRIRHHGISSRTMQQISVNQSCAIVMCANRCPSEQYLRLSPEGCETCDCYDPCQSIQCGPEARCAWKLVESRQPGSPPMLRPRTRCVHECKGGKKWSGCGSTCELRCNNTMPICTAMCVRGCTCPRRKPVWHRGRCIPQEQCKDECEGNQQWTETGRETAITCADSPNTTNTPPDTDHQLNIPRCQCPDLTPIWDDKQQLCVAKLEDCQRLATSESDQ